jgi:hypothetical protein
MNIIEHTLSQVRVGPGASYHNLTVFPILGPSSPKDYLVLDEALENGVARVTEISEQGHVPELRFINDAGIAILLLDGEELIGASYALDAIDDATPVVEQRPGSSPEQLLEPFLKSVAKAGYERFKAVGEGDDLRTSTSGICGAALVARDRVVHLAAFVQ